MSAFRLILSYSVLAILLLLGGNKSNAQDVGFDINIGKQYTLASEILKEERTYSVYLPASHGDSTLAESYPVLYVLDGGWYFEMAVGLVAFSKGAFRLPETIVVAIHSTDRIRDFTPSNSNLDMWGNEIQGMESSGGADLFIRFMQEELIPVVDATYRTMPHRILAGHSFAGLLATHAFLTGNSNFQSYILIDPSLWWDNAMMIEQTIDYLNEPRIVGNTVYLSSANDEATSKTSNAPHIESIDAFWHAIQSGSTSRTRSSYTFFDKETHASVGIPALYEGLSFLFDGYRPADNVFTEPSLLKSHFQSFSQQVGTAFPPPESLVRNLGYGKQYGEGDIESSIGFFSLNIENYPDSYHAYHVLAVAYEQLGKTEEAIQYYKKSLALQPNNLEAKEKLTALMEGK
ncbi:MAG: alpha/beta hydrolase-fold protein [Rhodothermales bacterium]